MIDYLISHPLYIPFIILNIYIIYKVIKYVLNYDPGKNDDDDDENGGNLKNDNPVLDLPPGVRLPVSKKESIINDWKKQYKDIILNFITLSIWKAADWQTINQFSQGDS